MRLPRVRGYERLAACNRLGAVDPFTSAGSAALSIGDFAFPGAGLVFSLIVKKGIPTDQEAPIAEVQAGNVYYRELIAKVKAGDFRAAASQATNGSLFNMAISAGAFKNAVPFYIAMIGNAIQNGDRARALAFASMIDATEERARYYKAVESQRQRDVQAPAQGMIEAAKSEGSIPADVVTRVIYNSENEPTAQYLTVVDGEQVWRDVARSGGGD